MPSLTTDVGQELVVASDHRDLDVLATEIREEHEQATHAFRRAVQHAVRCGELLEEVKARMPHGAWLPWLDEHFPASRRTAQGYMRLARSQDAQGIAHLGIAGALRKLSVAPGSATVPERDRESFTARHVGLLDDAVRLLKLLPEKIPLPGEEGDLQVIEEDLAWMSEWLPKARAAWSRRAANDGRCVPAPM